jgi:SAM-dependent methyltransferase
MPAGPDLKEATGMYVQYGAGHSAPHGWVNFDASPTLRLERLPLVGKIISVNKTRFPDGVIYGDIVKGLPVAPGSAAGVYSSHVLEHLPYGDVGAALRNTLKILRPGGIFRVIVPDLEERAHAYLARLASEEPGAGHAFVRSTLMGTEARTRGLLSMVRSHLGNSAHLWMWDRLSLRHALQDAGFDRIRQCEFNDSSDPRFSEVEDPGRYFDESLGIKELAFEACRPG